MKRKSWRATLYLAGGETKELNLVAHNAKDGVFVFHLDNDEVHFYPIAKVDKVIIHSEFIKMQLEAARAPQIQIPRPGPVLVPGDGRTPS